MLMVQMEPKVRKAIQVLMVQMELMVPRVYKVIQAHQVQLD